MLIQPQSPLKRTGRPPAARFGSADPADGQRQNIGLLLKSGTMVDATLIAAPSSTKNGSGQRDLQMDHAKLSSQWHFGMKAHIGADADSGLVRTVNTTSVRLHQHPLPSTGQEHPPNRNDLCTLSPVDDRAKRFLELNA